MKPWEGKYYKIAINIFSDCDIPEIQIIQSSVLSGIQKALEADYNELMNEYALKRDWEDQQNETP